MKIEAVPYHDTELYDISLGKQIGDALERHYPGYGWAIHVASDLGLIYIYCGWITAHVYHPYGFTQKFDRFSQTYDQMVAEAVRAGGEMLERARLPRSRFQATDIKTIDGVPDHHLII
jgi:hypothetical protein